jgi:hypothetical protein
MSRRHLPLLYFAVLLVAVGSGLTAGSAPAVIDRRLGLHLATGAALRLRVGR